MGCTPAAPLPTATPWPSDTPAPTATRLPTATPQPSPTPKTANAADFFGLAEMAYKNGQYQEAINNYSQAINLNPKFALAYCQRGTAYGNLSNYRQAEVDFNKAIELNPNMAYIYNQRGLFYQNLGDYRKAVDDMSQAIKLEPTSVNFYVHRGFAYTKAGEYDHALADYNQAIQLDATFADAYLGRGFVYHEHGDKEKAIADFKQVLKLTKDSKLQDLATKQLQNLGASKAEFATFNHTTKAFSLDVPAMALPSAKEKTDGLGVVFTEEAIIGKSIIMVSLNENEPPTATTFATGLPKMLNSFSFISSPNVTKSETESNRYLALFDYNSEAIGQGYGGLAVFPQGKNFYLLLVCVPKNSNFESTWQTVLNSFKVNKP